MNKNYRIALENMRDGMFIPPEFTEELLAKLDLPLQTSIIVPESYEMLPVLHARGYTNVTLLVSTAKKYVRNLVDKYGYQTKTLEDTTNMRFDQILGNPPYGRASNLAIEFLNKCKGMSNNMVFVMPRTLRNVSAMDRIDSKLHLVEDTDNPADTFAMELYTCTQTWEVREEDRPKSKKYTKDMVREDFEFTNVDSADICICAIGRYQIGQVFYPDVDYGHLKNFEERSPKSHHFIKIHKPAALDRLASLQTEFQEAASNTVAQSALSKHDLIRLYLGEE